jgi:phosphohistidine phosphatase
MQLFVVRHAIAVPRSGEIDEAARPLTVQGRRQWRRAVRGLQRLQIRPDRVYHSPWLRAAETADMLVDGVGGELVVTRRLAEEPGPALVRQLKGESVAVVGHQPWLGELIGLLVLGHADWGGRLVLGKGGVAWLEGEPRPGKMLLRALLPPKVLRASR